VPPESNGSGDDGVGSIADAPAPSEEEARASDSF
jgi:hypothetical protein